LRCNKVFTYADKIIAQKRFVNELRNLIYGLRNNDEDGSPLEININPKAIYTSRWMKFNLSKPVNSIKVSNGKGYYKEFFDLFILLNISNFYYSFRSRIS
jgi:hypothetical protein